MQLQNYTIDDMKNIINMNSNYDAATKIYNR